MIKKFILIVAATILTIAASAQTVEHSKLFENVSVTVDGGVVTPLNSGNDFFKNMRGTTGLEISKYVTPAVGFGLEGIVNFNTNRSNTLVDQSAVLGNLKINIFNLFANYKGYPRRVELVGKAGIGWGHDYGDSRIDPNYLVYNTGAEFNFNMGKQRAWQISLRPTILWNNYDNNPKFNKNDAVLRIAAGVTYKFGSRSKKSHNFVYCPYSVTKADYDAVVAELNALKNREPEVREIVKTETVIKEVPVESVKYVYSPLYVTFTIGSANLTAVEKAKIDEYIAGVDTKQVLVVGSADSRTGSARRNEYLAKERANVVAKYLKEKHNIDATVESTIDFNQNSVEASRAAIIDVNGR